MVSWLGILATCVFHSVLFHEAAVSLAAPDKTEEEKREDLIMVQLSLSIYLYLALFTITIRWTTIRTGMHKLLGAPINCILQESAVLRKKTG